MASGRPTSSGIEFGPNSSGKIYLCSKLHRGAGSSAHKTCWIIPEAEEYELFCIADAATWNDARGNYWAVCEGGEQIGENDERVAKFPVPQNNHDIWHGYPVRTGEDKPPSSLIELWYQGALISRTMRKRIKKGQV